MNEKPPEYVPGFLRDMTKNEEREEIENMRKMAAEQESHPFRGLDEAAYAKLKADEEEYPGYTTPIDELIKRFEEHGIKVVLGDDPKRESAFILPRDSTDAIMDSVLPSSLKIHEDMHPALVFIIQYDKMKLDARHGKK